jgi:hypothetical protein
VVSVIHYEIQPAFTHRYPADTIFTS